MNRWLDLPIDPIPGEKAPTWEAVAERYDRCLARLVSYVGRHVRDAEAADLVVAAALRQNVHLLVAEPDELGELRCLRQSADRLIALLSATARTR